MIEMKGFLILSIENDVSLAILQEKAVTFCDELKRLYASGIKFIAFHRY
jgi:hypothetical protein